MNHMPEEELSPEEQEFSIWLENGIERGWISEPYCHTHDGGMQYMSDEEIQEWEDGGDPCEHVLRIFIS
jgi:hypothetical protein